MTSTVLLRNLIPPQDPRTQGWFFVGNIGYLLTLLVSYIYLVKRVLPRFMKDRKPYNNLIPLIRAYNLLEVVLNIVFLAKVLPRTYLGGGYSFLCQAINFQTPKASDLEVINFCYWYLWVRVLDLLDTVFFVLRKKSEHVSFLHVAHHCIVICYGWCWLTFGTDGNSIFGILFNSFVHVIMYTYYFLASFGPSMRPYLFWKRYLTQLQIAQFIIVFLHGLIPLFFRCGYPFAHALVQQIMVVFFLVLFSKFYVKSYNNSKCKNTIDNNNSSTKLDKMKFW